MGRHAAVRVVIALSLFFVSLAPATATLLTQMDGRDAPSARRTAKAFVSGDLAETPVYTLDTLPEPTGIELLLRNGFMTSVQESLSFGRDPKSFMIDGRVSVPANTSKIRVKLGSTGARHLRSAWRFADDSEYEVTVFASEDLATPLVNRTGTSMNGDHRLVWSAITNGESQEVLITRLTPTTEPWTATLERVAHFDLSLQHQRPDTATKKALGLGDSAWCQSDIACVLDVLNDADDAVVLRASRAVARAYLTTAAGQTWWCTGTLLNSASFPRPFFLTAYHCTENAITLDTFWFYARTGCGVGTVSQATQITGGAGFVWTSKLLDSSLLELKEMPPAGAGYAGWNSAPITSSTWMLAVHHPRAT